MKIDNRRLQRRNNLRQSMQSNQLMHHTHAKWGTLSYTLFAGDTKYTTTSYRSVGARVYLNPVVLMYAVKAELVLTTTFPTAGVDSYSVNLVIGSDEYETVSSTATTYENTIIDITDAMQVYFKSFKTEEAYIQIKVSNASTSATLFGAKLNFTTYLTDTYGDYTNVVTPMLTDDSNIDKSFIKSLDTESKDFEYISGIVPM